MSKIEELNVEQTDDVAGGASEGASAKRTMQMYTSTSDRYAGAMDMDMNTNKTQYVNSYSSAKRLE
jgi:hypothetical protein